MKTLTLLLATLIIGGFSNAQIIFQKAYKGSYVSCGWSGVQTIDGGYIITGWDNPVLNNDRNIYLIKTDSTGDTLWTKWYGGFEDDRGFSVQQTTDSGYIVTGYTFSINVFSLDIFLIKTNSSGDTLWTKGFEGGGYETAYSVEQTNDGGFVFAGSGFNGAFIAKTDPDGNLLWTKSFEGEFWNWLPQINQTTDGGYIYTCSRSFPPGNSNVYLVKTDSSGNLIWSKMYDLGGTDHGYSVRQTTDGGYIINGTTTLTPNIDHNYLLKTDSVGNLLWAKRFGGSNSEYGFDVRQTLDGGYISTGSTRLGPLSYNVYVVKTDSIGNLLWSKAFGSLFSDEEGYTIQLTSDGGFIVTGCGILSSSCYFIKTDSAGNSGCNQLNTATVVTTPTVITTTPTTVFNTVSFILKSTGFYLGSGSNVTDLCATGIEEPSLNNSILIAPNPTSGIFTVSTSDKFRKGNIEIYSSFGNMLYEEQLNSNSAQEINLIIASPGIYIVKGNL